VGGNLRWMDGIRYMRTAMISLCTCS
jgi:hypothetical protein